MIKSCVVVDCTQLSCCAVSAADIDLPNLPTISILPSSSGPIIHDVTDTIEDSGLAGLVELPLDQDSDDEEEDIPDTLPAASPQITEVDSSENIEFLDLPVLESVYDSNKDLVAASLEEA